MNWLKICVFYSPKAVIKILLDAAASVFLDDMGAFADRLAVWDTVLVFRCLHEKNSFLFSIRMCEKTVFHASDGEICFVYFLFEQAMVIGNL